MLQGRRTRITGRTVTVTKQINVEDTRTVKPQARRPRREKTLRELNAHLSANYDEYAARAAKNTRRVAGQDEI